MSDYNRVSYHDITLDEIEEAFRSNQGTEFPAMTRELLWDLRSNCEWYTKRNLTSPKLIRALRKYEKMGLIREEKTIYARERRWSFIGWPKGV